MLRHLVLVLLVTTLLGACSSTPTEADAGTDAGKPVVTSTVEDWRDEVLYQVLTDRFADGDSSNNQGTDPGALNRYHGGDFAGLEQKIPYLQALGITAVWISPVVKNVDEFQGGHGYHGYWAQDLSAVNPHFGDLQSMRHLVDALHAAGIKVMLDIVTNHFGQVFFYDLNGNGKPDDAVSVNGKTVSEWDPDFDGRGVQALAGGPANILFANFPEVNRVAPLPIEFQNPAWFHRMGRLKDYGDAYQVENGDFPGGLKDLRTSSPDVRDALYRVYANWIDVGDFDAFRIDTVKHVEASFWNEFCHRIRTHAAQIGKRNFLMVGEDLEGDSVKAGAYTQNDALDTVFNYPQKFVVDEVLNGKAPTQNLADVYAAVQKNFSQRPSESTSLTASQSTVNFLDNHDLGRFLASSSKPALKTALALILLEDGIPAIYYGTEQELSGKDDPNNREDLWKTKYATDGKTFGWIARLVKIRKAYPALRRGRLTFRMTTRNFASESDAGLLVFERSEGAQTVLVAINVSDSHPSTATGISVGLDEGTRLTDVLGGQKVTVGAARSLSLTVPPRETLILVRDSELVSGL